MEIAECFEEWDDPDIETLNTINLDSLLLLGEEEEEVDEPADCSGSEEDEDEDDESEKKLKCCKCQKVYHTSGWLKRHEESCTGAIGKARKRKPEKLSEHQRKTRAILADLGFEEYFIRDCLPAILHFLKEITSTKSAIVKLRGKRFADSQRQADFLVAELEKGTENEVKTLLKNIAKKLWTITFARDNLLSTSSRQQYVAQHLNQFRSSGELGSKWIELNHLGSLSTDKLLLQKIVTVLYERINRYRSESVISALQICEEYIGETLHKRPFLTHVEKNIVAYIAGYVCRKTRDLLKRNYDTSSRSSSQTAKSKCERLDCIIKLLNHMVPGVAKQTPAMTYPNLMTLSLTRGGLSQVDCSTFTFFCYLEVSIRPFLSLARFRSSTRTSDSELLDQLIENSSLLKPTWPYSSSLPSEDSNLLLKLFVQLYFRVRKWAYLKVYKEERKVKEQLAHLNTSAPSVDLHGKDSIRKALMP